MKYHIKERDDSYYKFGVYDKNEMLVGKYSKYEWAEEGMNQLFQQNKKHFWEGLVFTTGLLFFFLCTLYLSPFAIAFALCYYPVKMVQWWKYYK